MRPCSSLFHRSCESVVLSAWGWARPWHCVPASRLGLCRSRPTEIKIISGRVKGRRHWSTVMADRHCFLTCKTFHFCPPISLIFHHYFAPPINPEAPRYISPNMSTLRPAPYIAAASSDQILPVHCEEWHRTVPDWRVNPPWCASCRFLFVHTQRLCFRNPASLPWLPVWRWPRRLLLGYWRPWKHCRMCSMTWVACGPCPWWRWPIVLGFSQWWLVRCHISSLCRWWGANGLQPGWQILRCRWVGAGWCPCCYCWCCHRCWVCSPPWLGWFVRGLILDFAVGAWVKLEISELANTVLQFSAKKQPPPETV